jgi:hypothetical protein
MVGVSPPMQEVVFPNILKPSCWEHQWLMPVILAPQVTDIRESRFKASRGKQFGRPYLKKKKNHKKGLLEWLKV